MKIDVEGAEVDVLRGASQLMHNHHPTLCIEFHSRILLNECCALLIPEGYHVELLEYGTAADVPEDGVGHLIATAGR